MPGKPRGEIKYLFLMCNDVSSIIAFYGATLGLDIEGGVADGFADIKAGVDIIFFKGDFDLPKEKEWAWQPGYKGGGGNFTSWSIAFNEQDFRDVVRRVKAAGVETFNATPEWRRDAYWGLTVKDPMGHTVELYTSPLKKPDNLQWPEQGE